LAFIQEARVIVMHNGLYYGSKSGDSSSK